MEAQVTAQHECTREEADFQCNIPPPPVPGSLTHTHTSRYTQCSLEELLGNVGERKQKGGVDGGVGCMCLSDRSTYRMCYRI